MYFTNTHKVFEYTNTSVFINIHVYNVYQFTYCVTTYHTFKRQSLVILPISFLREHYCF